MTTPSGLTDSTLGENLAAWCPDLPNWAHSWRQEERDVGLGEEIVKIFKPFLFDLLRQNLTRRTFCRHRDNLWLLGGQIIRSVNLNPALRRSSAQALISDLLSPEGGPLIGCHVSEQESEQEQRSFDTTCRLLYRFLASRASDAGTD
jgi:hypothetical protein